MAQKSSSGFSQAQYQALCDAIAEGALEVQYSDKRIKYRSLDEMLKIKSMMQKDLTKCTSKKKGLFGGARIEAEHDKDLN